MDSERLLPVTPSKKLLLRRMVAQGRLWMSSSSSRCIVKSVFGGLPPPFLGSRDPPRSEILEYRFTEERLTLNRRAVADLERPPST